MRGYFFFFLALAGLFLSVPATAQEVKIQLGAARNANTAQAFRASKLIGMEVKNAKGEALGSINDFVVDERGQVRYIAVSFGGVLGVGSKLFAVPYKTFTFKTDVDAESRYAELNVDKQLLEKAPGFPSDRWPDFGDQKFVKEVDAFYNDLGSIKAPNRN